MTIPAGTIVAQNQLLYRKHPVPGQTPTIFTVLCNCGSSQRDKTARFVDANRHLFLTHDQFKAGEWA
jgi:phosphoribosyl 1,2-cyclic phosphodiesterase